MSLTSPSPDPESPTRYSVLLDTTVGEIIVDVDRALSPHGADRFHHLVSLGFYDQAVFYRAVAGFMVQFGLNADPAVSAAWKMSRIPDDPVRAPNIAGSVSFATSGPNARSTQIFINLGDNRRLDGMGFSPFGKVQSLDVVKKIYTGYGDGPPGGQGPQQGRIHREGNAYLSAEFPQLDAIRTARVKG